MSRKDGKPNNNKNEELFEIDAMLSDIEPADDSVEDILSEVYGTKKPETPPEPQSEPEGDAEPAPQAAEPEEIAPQNIVQMPPVLRQQSADSGIAFLLCPAPIIETVILIGLLSV